MILIHLGIVESHPDLLSFSQKRYCSEVKNRKEIYQNGYIITDKENAEITYDFSVLVRVTGFEPAGAAISDSPNIIAQFETYCNRKILIPEKIS